MSAQTMAEAWAPIEASHRDRILAETWGHLAPHKNRIYKGFIVFAVGCFGDDPLNPTALHCEFEDLDSSPWFFDAMAEFLGEQKTEEGGVYRFDGTSKNYIFSGKVQKVMGNWKKQ